MKKIFTLLLLGCIMLIGCGNEQIQTEIVSELETESDEIENTLDFPYIIENEYGELKVSNIIIQQSKTEHGYEGFLVVEIDLSDLTEDDLYWFAEDYEIAYVFNHGSILLGEDEIELDYETVLDNVGTSDYIVYSIPEIRNPITEYDIDLSICVSEKDNFSNSSRVYINGGCSYCEIVEELPDEIDTPLSEHYQRLINYYIGK